MDTALSTILGTKQWLESGKAGWHGLLEGRTGHRMSGSLGPGLLLVFRRGDDLGAREGRSPLHVTLSI